jgi:hypothetical protein
LEATLHQHAVFEGRRVDVLQMACFAEETPCDPESSVSGGRK